MGLGWAQGVRAPRGVLPPRSRQCWGVVEEEQYDDREAAVEDAERAIALNKDEVGPSCPQHPAPPQEDFFF